MLPGGVGIGVVAGGQRDAVPRLIAGIGADDDPLAGMMSDRAILRLPIVTGASGVSSMVLPSLSVMTGSPLGSRPMLLTVPVTAPKVAVTLTTLPWASLCTRTSSPGAIWFSVTCVAGWPASERSRMVVSAMGTEVFWPLTRTVRVCGTVSV